MPFTRAPCPRGRQYEGRERPECGAEGGPVLGKETLRTEHRIQRVRTQSWGLSAVEMDADLAVLAGVEAVLRHSSWGSPRTHCIRPLSMTCPIFLRAASERCSQSFAPCKTALGTFQPSGQAACQTLFSESLRASNTDPQTDPVLSLSTLHLAFPPHFCLFRESFPILRGQQSHCIAFLLTHLPSCL